MKHLILRLFTVYLLALPLSACAQQQEAKTNENRMPDKLKGEWIMSGTWTDSLLTFRKATKADKDEQGMPVINIIVFEKDNLVQVYTYGIFGCGTAASQNLNMYDTQWRFADGKLNLKGKYSDYTGMHLLNHFYAISGDTSTLTLTRTNLDQRSSYR